eukprot:c16745_g1_i1.p1 GENE.c16745_g1_i1~~c16745_g1_i1.p1  ORF type:complete len:392 (+),score=177.46 c16745_g1_i1:31-1206(+)
MFYKTIITKFYQPNNLSSFSSKRMFYSLAEITRVLGQDAALKMKEQGVSFSAHKKIISPNLFPTTRPINLLVLTKNSEKKVFENLSGPPKEVSVHIGDVETLIKVASQSNTESVVLSWESVKSDLESLITQIPRLSWVHSSTAGVDRIMSPVISQSCPVLTNAKGAFSSSLGEWAIFSSMFFLKRVPEMRESQEKKEWNVLVIEELRGKVFGIVGYGDIGRECATRAKFLGMKVLALRRRPELSSVEEGIIDKIYHPNDLNQLLSECDFVVNSLPLTNETRGMIGKEQFDSMKKNSVFINVGRGATVDENALIVALKEEKIKGAALDVFQQEPLPSTHPFYEMTDKVLLSAHCADRTVDYDQLTMNIFLENLLRFLNHQQLENIVDLKNGY